MEWYWAVFFGLRHGRHGVGSRSIHIHITGSSGPAFS